MRRILLTLLVATLAAAGLLTAPVSAQPSAPINSTNPVNFGDWDVGLHTFEIVDDTREGRTLVVDLWYPIDPEATEGAQRAELELLVANLELNAFDDPPPAREGNFPLVVFSHGSGGLRSQSWELMEVMASHGYVVAAPDHTGNTALDNSDSFATSAYNRPRDVSLVIDTVLEFDRTRGNQFHRTIDQRRIAVSGHSFGGFTALAMAGGFGDFEPDRRVDVIIPMAPAAAILSYSELRNVKVPTLLLGGTSDTTTPISVHTDYAWDILRSKTAYRVDIEAAGHNSFTNVCELFDALVDAGLPDALLDQLRGAAEEGCAPELIDIDFAHFLTYGYTMTFLNSTLGNRPRLANAVTQDFADLFELPVQISVRSEVDQ